MGGYRLVVFFPTLYERPRRSVTTADPIARPRVFSSSTVVAFACGSVSGVRVMAYVRRITPSPPPAAFV